MRDQVKVGEQKCADLENELAALRQSGECHLDLAGRACF